MGDSLSRREDDWQRRATAAAVAAARQVALGDAAAINCNTPIGRLSDTEWGWIIAAVLFAWIRTRAEQATAEGLNSEQTIRLTGLDPDPDAGAITAILPQLADASEIDWSKPLAAWSREAMTDFLMTALRLIRAGMVASDLGGGTIARKSPDMPSDPIPF